MRPVCGAPARSTGKPCRCTALGPSGRCRAHGGWAGAPAGNKNAVTHGAHETIFAGLLTADEAAVFRAVGQKSNLEQVDDELGLITVREMRMLQRIKTLQDAITGMTVVEVTEKTLAADDDEGPAPARPYSDRWASELPVDAPETRKAARQADGDGGGGGVLEVKTKRMGTLGQIQSIEAALTGVQAQKAKLIRLKHDLVTAAKTNTLDDRDFDGSLWDEGLEDDEG